MQIVNGKLVLGTRNCTYCCYGEPGKMAGKKVCDSCKGTGNGKRGKPGGCRDCYGDRTRPDWDNPETCPQCNGAYADASPETMSDYLPPGMFASLEFRTQRHERRATVNESLVGFGFIFCCTDYGAAWKAADDAALVANVKSHGSTQASSVAKDDGSLCRYVLITVMPGGYTVRAVFDE